MTRATTAKDDDDDDDGVVVVIIASSLFLFRLSLSLSRAHRVGGSEKPSRQSPIFEKMRETKAAPKTQRRGSTSASLSLKKNDTHALLRFRTTTTTVSSLLLLSTDIRKIQNKSGEPETVENARWRIMIRCDEAKASSLSKREKEARERFKICALFFFSIHHRFDIRRGKRPRERKRTPPSSAN